MTVIPTTRQEKTETVHSPAGSYTRTVVYTDDPLVRQRNNAACDWLLMKARERKEKREAKGE